GAEVSPLPRDLPLLPRRCGQHRGLAPSARRGAHGGGARRRRVALPVGGAPPRAVRAPDRDGPTRERAMKLHDRTILITGANRGVGEALVNEALRRGAKKIYAGTRGELRHLDQRVTPLTLDVTSDLQIQRAAEQIEALDVVINNAGIAL